MELRGLRRWRGRGGGVARQVVAPGLHPARACLPRWARSEMTSLFSQSFRPAGTRHAVSRHGQRARLAPLPATPGQESTKVAPAISPCRGPGVSPRPPHLSPRGLRPGTSRARVQAQAPHAPLAPALSAPAPRPRPASSSDPVRASGRLPLPLNGLQGEQLAVTPWPSGLGHCLSPGAPRSHILPWRRGRPSGPQSWPDIRVSWGASSNSRAC